MDSNRVNRLVEKNGLGPKPLPYPIPVDVGVFRNGSQVRAWSLGAMVWKSLAILQSVRNSCGTNGPHYSPTRIAEPGHQSHASITYQRRTCPPPFPSPSRTRFLSYPVMVLLKPNQQSKKYGIKCRFLGPPGRQPFIGYLLCSGM